MLLASWLQRRTCRISAASNIMNNMLLTLLPNERSGCILRESSTTLLQKTAANICGNMSPYLGLHIIRHDKQDVCCFRKTFPVIAPPIHIVW